MGLSYTTEEIENYLKRLKKLLSSSKTKLIYQKNKDKNSDRYNIELKKFRDI